MLSHKVVKFYSPVSGHGIKALENIKTDELIIKFEGKVIPKSQADKLYQEGFDYMLQIGPEEFLLLEEDSKYVNHSCAPNSAFLHQSAELVALRDIHQGEEIFFDYSANENTEFELNCLCNTINCRKKILPYFKNNEEEQKLLNLILTPYIKKQPQT